MGHFEVAALKILVVLSHSDTHADFFTVRKTEEISNMQLARVIHHILTLGRSLEAKIVMFEVVDGVRKRVLFLLIMWQHVVDKRRMTPSCH